MTATIPEKKLHNQSQGRRANKRRLGRANLTGSKKLATGLQACRSSVFWKGFASPPKTVAPETPAFRPGSAPTGLKAGVSNRS